MAEKLKSRQSGILFSPPRHLSGYALTEYLETNPQFIALLAAVKGGNEELPAYIRQCRNYIRQAVKSETT